MLSATVPDRGMEELLALLMPSCSGDLSGAALYGLRTRGTALGL